MWQTVEDLIEMDFYTEVIYDYKYITKTDSCGGEVKTNFHDDGFP